MRSGTSLGCTTAVHSLELKVPPLFLWVIFAAAMYGLARAVPVLSLSVPGAAAIALVLAVTGAALALSGVLAFRRERTTVNPLAPSELSAVVSRGVYRLSRNPMYLGFLIALAGWGVYLSSFASALLLPVFVAYMNRFQIKPEERVLLAKFAQEYAQYMSRVRRWI
jgi:protein-S-isoprenylcysteine O-methyltransferase Ste14